MALGSLCLFFSLLWTPFAWSCDFQQHQHVLCTSRCLRALPKSSLFPSPCLQPGRKLNRQHSCLRPAALQAAAEAGPAVQPDLQHPPKGLSEAGLPGGALPGQQLASRPGSRFSGVPAEAACAEPQWQQAEHFESGPILQSSEAALGPELNLGPTGRALLSAAKPAVPASGEQSPAHPGHRCLICPRATAAVQPLRHPAGVAAPPCRGCCATLPTFCPLIDLDTQVLSGNQLQQVVGQVFASLKRLTCLILSDNRLALIGGYEEEEGRGGG